MLYVFNVLKALFFFYSFSYTYLMKRNNAPTDNRYAEWLRAAMDRYDLSQYKLGQLAGIPQPTIQRILSGATAHPNNDTLDKLVSALDAAESRFRKITGSEPPSSDLSSLSPVEQAEHILSENYLCITASGSSVASIPKNSKVYVKPAAELRPGAIAPGQIVAAFIDGQLTFCRVDHVDNEIVATSDTPSPREHHLDKKAIIGLALMAMQSFCEL